MTNIRRYYIPEAIYFITCVTYSRKNLFHLSENISLFWEIAKNLKKIHPHKLYAHALIFNHFHFLILPLQENIHVIRNEDDFKRHLDYIHYNPVKHGIVERPEDFKQSSYLHWLKKGFYQVGWGHTRLKNLEEMNLE